MSTNMKPADELLSVRQKIKMLQAREAELKTGMVAGDLPLEGDFSIARVVVRPNSRFDKKACEKKFGDLSEFVTKSESKTLLVDELVMPEMEG